MNTLVIDTVWLVLLAGTGLTFWIGESGRAGPAAMGVVLGLAFVKGVLVAREFMMLRGVRFVWQAAVIGWLAVVLTAILFCFWRA